jgi:hypothetical protein
VVVARRNSERTRAVAQILTIVRGFGIPENDTPLTAIRAECERLKVYDMANFSTYLKSINGFVVTGSGQARRLKVRSPGVHAFGGLVDSATHSGI